MCKKQHCKKDTNTRKVPQEVAKDKLLHTTTIIWPYPSCINASSSLCVMDCFIYETVWQPFNKGPSALQFLVLQANQSPSFQSKSFEAKSLLARYCQEPPSFRPGLGACSCANCISAWCHFWGLIVLQWSNQSFNFWIEFSSWLYQAELSSSYSILHKQLYLQECCSMGESLHCSLLVFLLRFFPALNWVWIVNNNYGVQETALQEGRKHQEGPSRSCKGQVVAHNDHCLTISKPH